MMTKQVMLRLLCLSLSLLFCLAAVLPVSAEAAPADGEISIPTPPPDDGDAFMLIGCGVCLIAAAIAVGGAVAALRKKGREAAEALEQEEKTADKPDGE